jgi:hypothetical protein
VFAERSLASLRLLAVKNFIASAKNFTEARFEADTFV